MEIDSIWSKLTGSLTPITTLPSSLSGPAFTAPTPTPVMFSTSPGVGPIGSPPSMKIGTELAVTWKVSAPSWPNTRNDSMLPNVKLTGSRKVPTCTTAGVTVVSTVIVSPSVEPWTWSVSWSSQLKSLIRNVESVSTWITGEVPAITVASHSVVGVTSYVVPASIPLIVMPANQFTASMNSTPLRSALRPEPLACTFSSPTRQSVSVWMSSPPSQTLSAPSPASTIQAQGSTPLPP